MDIERQIMLTGNEVVQIFTGVLVCLLGYFIWVKQKLVLLAGYKERFIKEKKELCGFLGKWLFAAGVLTVLLPLGVRIFSQQILWLYAAIILITAIRIYVKIPYYMLEKD